MNSKSLTSRTSLITFGYTAVAIPKRCRLISIDSFKLSPSDTSEGDIVEVALGRRKMHPKASNFVALPKPDHAAVLDLS